MPLAGLRILEMNVKAAPPMPKLLLLMQWLLMQVP